MNSSPNTEHRRSTRVPLELSIEVDGQSGSLPFKAATLVVNLHGALICTVKPLDVGSTIYLRVPNGGESPARVVRALPNPLTYGIELVEPTNIWGISMPPSDWKTSLPEGSSFQNPDRQQIVAPEGKKDVSWNEAHLVTPKKPYVPPQVGTYKSVEDLPSKFRTVAAQILAEQPILKVTVDDDHRYLAVSEEFARLLGYTSRELIGKRVDEITTKDTLDIEFAFQASRRLGELQGLWLFERRDGKKLLCSFRARRSQSQLTAELKPVFVAA
jgi:PAS domain S-box-containing protein